MVSNSLSKHIPDLSYMTMLAESKNSWIHRASPWTKLIMLFSNILLIIIIDNLIILSLFYLVILLVYASAKLPLKVLKNWYFLPLYISITIALPLIFNKEGNFFLFYIDFGWFHLYLSDLGLISLLTLIIRALSSVTLSFIFIMTTKYKEIAYIIHRIFPSTFSDILLLTYRYIFLMMDEIDGRIKALQLRGGSLLKYSINLQNFGSLIALTIISGIDRGTRLAKAMQARGGGSEQIYVNEPVKLPKFRGIIFLSLYLFAVGCIGLFGLTSLVIFCFNLFSILKL